MNTHITVTLRGVQLRLVCVGETYRFPGDFLRVDDKFTPEERTYCDSIRDAQIARRRIKEQP